MKTLEKSKITEFRGTCKQCGAVMSATPQEIKYSKGQTGARPIPVDCPECGFPGLDLRAFSA